MTVLGCRLTKPSPTREKMKSAVTTIAGVSHTRHAVAVGVSCFGRGRLRLVRQTFDPGPSHQHFVEQGDVVGLAEATAFVSVRQPR